MTSCKIRMVAWCAHDRNLSITTRIKTSEQDNGISNKAEVTERRNAGYLTRKKHDRQNVMSARDGLGGRGRAQEQNQKERGDTTRPRELL